MGLGPYKAVSSIQQFSVAPLPMPSPEEGHRAAGRKGFLLPVNFFFALIPEATVSPYRSSVIQLSVCSALIKAILFFLPLKNSSTSQPTSFLQMSKCRPVGTLLSTEALSTAKRCLSLKYLHLNLIRVFL